VAERPGQRIDLHCHSTASDGTLSPARLLQRACARGVELLALTDHDTLAGLQAAHEAARHLPLQLVNGVEVSTDFQGRVLHILALGFELDAQNPLALGLAESDRLRRRRGQRIQERLARKGMADAAERAEQLCSQGQALTRTHFARALLELGYCTDMQQAFDRWLGRGKSCYQKARWPELEPVLSWITRSGGVAVLAHPLRYQLSGAWMRRVLTAFRKAGGSGLEVVTGHYNPDSTRRSAQWAREFELMGSAGSDFHSPDNPHVELGRLEALPAGIRPIWSLW